MDIQVVHGDLDFTELQEFFLAIKMEDCHISFSVLPSGSENSLEILVQRDGDDFSLAIPQLGFLARSSPRDLTNTVKDVVVSCSGYKRSTIRGLTVRDSQRKKHRPEIDIYAPRSFFTEFPDDLEYLKHPPVQQQTLLKIRVCFCSEILSDILDCTSLSFKAHGEIYELTIEDGVPYIHYKASVPVLSVDFLTCYTVSRDLLETVGLRSGAFPTYIRSIINRENTSRPKNLFKNLAKSKKEMEYALKVVENAPKFYDSRDEVLGELRDFLASHHTESVGKYEYLEVVRQVVPKDKNKFALGNFLGP